MPVAVRIPKMPRFEIQDNATVTDYVEFPGIENNTSTEEILLYGAEAPYGGNLTVVVAEDSNSELVLLLDGVEHTYQTSGGMVITAKFNGSVAVKLKPALGLVPPVSVTVHRYFPTFTARVVLPRPITYTPPTQAI